MFQQVQLLLLLPFDRILDRLRTVVNVWGDLVCAMTVNHFTSQKKHSPNLKDASVKLMPTYAIR